jgi:hypothetical protein
MTDIKSGEVGIIKLVANAKKSGDTVISTDGYSKSDVNFIIKKAKEYGIPVAFGGKKNADNICVHVRGSDKTIFERICTEMMGEKLSVRPQELENFKAERWEIDGIQRELSKHDLNANWGKTKDGEYFCLYEKADRKVVLIARDQFVKKCEEIERNLTITRNGDGFYTLKDSKCGNEISFTDIPTQSELSEMFRERFGYDENKAEIACAKFGEKHLDGAEKRGYFNDNPQNEFSDIQNHIELKDENILVKHYDCLRVTPKTDGVPRIVFRDDNNNFAVLNPDKMTRKKMTAILTETLGIEDEKTALALVDKAERVNEYYVKQNEVNFVFNQNGGEDNEIPINSNIERISRDEFRVDTNETTLVLSFSDKKNAISKLQAMFMEQGLSEESAKQSAKEVFSKARAQSAEKVLHIEEIKVMQQSAEVHGDAQSETIMTVKYGGKSEEIGLTELDKAFADLMERFGVSEEDAEMLLNQADERINEATAPTEKVKTGEQSEDKTKKKPQNGHEKKPVSKSGGDVIADVSDTPKPAKNEGGKVYAKRN